MDADFLTRVVLDQRETAEARFRSEKIVPRDGIAEARAALKRPNLLLVSGMRRAGKSMFSLLVAGGPAKPRINFDDERLSGFKSADFDALLESFYRLHGEPDFLILDEVQNVAGWELFASRIRDRFRVIITGSNANLLSSELATRLTGRFMTKTVFPLGFREFLTYRGCPLPSPAGCGSKEKSRIDSLMAEYLVEGGVFERHQFGEEFLRTAFSSIITKDIVVRHGIRHAAAVEELGVLAVNHFAQKLSLSRLTQVLGLKSPHTTREYLKFMEDAFLVFTNNRFSHKVKEQFSTLRKIYVTDNGLISALNRSLSPNQGRLLENLVAGELARRALADGARVFYWEERNLECDFVVHKGRRMTLAAQACLELNPDNRRREILGLTSAMQDLGLKEGFILTKTQEETLQEGAFRIFVMPAWKWMLGHGSQQ